MPHEAIKKQLKKIIKEEPNSIKAFVAQEVLAAENFKTYFNDLTKHGCVSGMVNSLICLHDTHQFFDLYYHEIEILRGDFEEETGTTINLGYDLKNTLAWFAFEQTAYKLAEHLGFSS